MYRRISILNQLLATNLISNPISSTNVFNHFYMSSVTKQSVLLNEIHPGDIFSEESHYVFQQKAGAQFQFKHLESGNTINLDEKYVQDLLITADQYHKEVEVGKEDKLWTEKQITEAKAKGQLPAESNVREGDVLSLIHI